MNRWPNCPDIPTGPRAALAALHLTDPSPDCLRRLNSEEWRAALEFCDAARLTLVLREQARDAMPPEVLEQVDKRAAKNVVRARRFEELYRELDARLSAAGLEFLALKGLTHGGLPGRVQYDIDLYLLPETVHAAQKILVDAGWTPLRSMESFPTDHLPALVRDVNWKWRGDYFDPQLPIAVELHFRFWSEETERLPCPGVEAFWERRIRRSVAGVEIAALCEVDALAYAALHVLRHVFQGSVYAFHVYELARMLEARAVDDAFWAEWRLAHSPELRRLESVAFRLAREWFGCANPAIEILPERVETWLAHYALSPATQSFRPNKDHLWLHLALLDSAADVWRVTRRRLAPANLPPREGIRRVGLAAYALYSARRLRHHALSLPRTAVSGLHLWRSAHGLGGDFWRFTSAAALFNFGLFIFFLHYNLFLLDLGFREDFVGAVNSAMRAGSMAGTIPAAFLARRLGLRSALLWTMGLTSAAECLRSAFGARLPLTALAFASGCIFAVWAVLLAPLVAGLVGEPRRAKAFSAFFACMIVTGVVANQVGGMLGAWVHDRRVLLFAGAAISASGILPALRLKDFPAPTSGARVYPRSSFLALFLIPFAAWHLATGAFNPLQNVFLKRLGFSDRAIGSVFAGSQAMQVVALLLAPAVIGRLGLVSGIGAMMAATAAALLLLGSHLSPWTTIAAYIAYMSFQWMSEPALNTLLMNGVKESERSGASAVNYVVAFGAQALAAWAGGLLVTRFGYGSTLAGAAVGALLAATLFPALLRRRVGSARE